MVGKQRHSQHHRQQIEEVVVLPNNIISSYNTTKNSKTQSFETCCRRRSPHDLLEISSQKISESLLFALKNEHADGLTSLGNNEKLRKRQWADGDVFVKKLETELNRCLRICSPMHLPHMLSSPISRVMNRKIFVFLNVVKTRFISQFS